MSHDLALNKAVFFFSFVDEANHELQLISGDGACEDLAGNDLDGESFGPSRVGTRSGNGAPGGDYLLQFTWTRWARDPSILSNGSGLWAVSWR